MDMLFLEVLESVAGKGRFLPPNIAGEHKVPYFGICLGMQVMIVEFARHVLGSTEADSTEMNIHTPNPVISLLKPAEEYPKSRRHYATRRLPM